MSPSTWVKVPWPCALLFFHSPGRLVVEGEVLTIILRSIRPLLHALPIALITYPFSSVDSSIIELERFSRLALSTLASILNSSLFSRLPGQIFSEVYVLHSHPILSICAFLTLESLVNNSCSGSADLLEVFLKEISAEVQAMLCLHRTPVHLTHPLCCTSSKLIPF